MREDKSLDEKLAPHAFVTDFVWAVRAVLAQPIVAIVSIALWWLPIALPPATKQPVVVMLASIIWLSFDLGWVGAERMFFLRRREGTNATLRELLGAVPTFMGRFLRLGCLLSAAFAPLALVSGYLIGRFGVGVEAVRAAGKIGLVFFSVALDLLLTFVPSALVFTTGSAREALRIGVRMIRQTWPRSGLYVLCPPMALGMLNVIYPNQIPMVRVATTAALALLMLFAKGATVAFYLRERPPIPEVVGASSAAPVQAQ